MPRSIWTGSITFGLVNVPIRLFSATSAKEVHFHMLHERDGARVQLRRFCSLEGAEIPYEEIVKGYELSRGQYVVVEPKELEAIDPKATRSVDIEDFVALEEIDPIYFERTYYTAPDRGAAKAYSLLLEAMRATGKVGIARMVMRTKQYLCCVRPMGNALALSTMMYADEIVAQEDVDLPDVGSAKPREKEMEMARQLIESLASPFEPEKYRDEYRERVLELIERKAEGKAIVAPAEVEREEKVINLADALARSLERARTGEGRRARTEERGRVEHREERAAARTAKGKGKAAPRTAARRPSRKRKSS